MTKTSVFISSFSSLKVPPILASFAIWLFKTYTSFDENAPMFHFLLLLYHATLLGCIRPATIFQRLAPIASTNVRCFFFFNNSKYVFVCFALHPTRLRRRLLCFHRCHLLDVVTNFLEKPRPEDTTRIAESCNKLISGLLTTASVM